MNKKSITSFLLGAVLAGGTVVAIPNSNAAQFESKGGAKIEFTPVSQKTEVDLNIYIKERNVLAQSCAQELTKRDDFIQDAKSAGAVSDIPLLMPAKLKL